MEPLHQQKHLPKKTLKKKYSYPNGNPGATTNLKKLKAMHSIVIMNKNAEIRYLRKQYNGMIIRMQIVLSASTTAGSRNLFPGGDNVKYCPCCGHTLKE